MNAITKSGTNSIHGDVFEFLRNDKFDARNYFDPSRAELRRNQFGYAVGGPFWKNKLFWFTDYQGTRQVVGASTGLVTLPTVDQRNGIFSASDFLDSSDNPLTGGVPGFESVTPTRAQQFVISNTKTFGPTAVNQFRASFFRTATVTDKPQTSFANLSDLGFVTGVGTLGINPSGPPGFPQTVPPIF